MKSAFITLLVVALLGVISLFAVIYNGTFNVAATENHSRLTKWIFSAARESSIEKHAAGIEVPNLNDEKKIKNGFRSYREMCAVCHTPPGDDDSPIAQGLNPRAPNLGCEAEELSDAELFWVIKNGIRMTGMPAWGVTHGDKEIWAVVAFVKALPKMTAEQYKALDRSTEAGHSHGANAHDMGMMEEHGAGGHGHDMGKKEEDEAGGHGNDKGKMEEAEAGDHSHDTGKKEEDEAGDHSHGTGKKDETEAGDHGHSHGTHTH
jgi:mono/diheme cytochrome c family protein